MTDYTPILHMPQVAPNQNQKETTINTDLAILEAACNDYATISLVSGNRTLTTDEFTRNFHIVFSGQTAIRTVTFPTTPRFLAVSNEGTFNLSFKTAGVGTTVTVEPAKRVLLISDGTNVVAISAGISVLSSLSDVVGALDASTGQALVYDGGSETLGPRDLVVPFAFFVEGTPTASQRVYREIMVDNVRLLSDFSSSQGIADVAATASTVFQVFKNAGLVGTITFAAAGTVPTFSTDPGSGSASVTLAPGDILSIVAPASPDGTLADIAVTLKGVSL